MNIQKLQQWCVLVTLLSVGPSAQAHNLVTGQVIPELTIADRGELLLKGDDFGWQPWSTRSLLGRVQVIQYLAPTLSASKLNERFIGALAARGFPKDKYASVSILNMDDATFGTSSLVISGTKDSKKQQPDVFMVIDKCGAGRKLWQLAKSNSAIIVLDKNGSVAFAKEGALNDAEIADTLTLIERLL